MKTFKSSYAIFCKNYLHIKSELRSLEENQLAVQWDCDDRLSIETGSIDFCKPKHVNTLRLEFVKFTVRF